MNEYRDEFSPFEEVQTTDSTSEVEKVEDQTTEKQTAATENLPSESETHIEELPSESDNETIEMYVEEWTGENFNYVPFESMSEIVETGSIVEMLEKVNATQKFEIYTTMFLGGLLLALIFAIVWRKL